MVAIVQLPNGFSCSFSCSSCPHSRLFLIQPFLPTTDLAEQQQTQAHHETPVSRPTEGDSSWRQCFLYELPPIEGALAELPCVLPRQRPDVFSDYPVGGWLIFRSSSCISGPSLFQFLPDWVSSEHQNKSLIPQHSD